MKLNRWFNYDQYEKYEMHIILRPEVELVHRFEEYGIPYHIVSDDFIISHVNTSYREHYRPLLGTVIRCKIVGRDLLRALDYDSDMVYILPMRYSYVTPTRILVSAWAVKDVARNVVRDQPENLLPSDLFEL